MPARRVEDRIRELCAQAIYTKEPEWGDVIRELQQAIREHMIRVANLATAATLPGARDVVSERRQR